MHVKLVVCRFLFLFFFSLHFLLNLLDCLFQNQETFGGEGRGGTDGFQGGLRDDGFVPVQMLERGGADDGLVGSVVRKVEGRDKIFPTQFRCVNHSANLFLCLKIEMVPTMGIHKRCLWWLALKEVGQFLLQLISLVLGEVGF
jgi:hypothetical protein